MAYGQIAIAAEMRAAPIQVDVRVEVEVGVGGNECLWFIAQIVSQCVCRLHCLIDCQ